MRTFDMMLCRFFQTTGLLRTLAVALTTAVLALQGGYALATEPLRVCADPDNLPFSKSEGPERGIYIDLAELVAQRLNATPVHYTWWLTFYQRRALRNTANECDAVFALPTDADYKVRGLQKTAAFLDVGYALVSAPSFTFNGLDDLKGKRLAVQFQTNPHILLSQRNDLPFSTFKTSEEIFALLAKGEIDAGFLWGPSAGFDNLKQHSGRWKVTPLTGPDLTGQVSVAVQRDKAELVQDIDAALLALKPQIAELAAKYGFPKTTPVKLDLVATAAVPPTVQALATRYNAVTIPAQWMVKTQATSEPDSNAPPKAKPQSKPKKKAATAGVATAGVATAAVAATAATEQTPALSASAQLGRVRFNDQCSHCHGSDGASPIRERDVRRLKMRYDAKWLETATTTIKNGRSDLGMPPWKDTLKDPEIQQVLSFLETIQK
jgi:polar amino acid transport system substrate-binding protein